MIIAFNKFQGTGNNCVIIDNRKGFFIPMFRILLISCATGDLESGLTV